MSVAVLGPDSKHTFWHKMHKQNHSLGALPEEINKKTEKQYRRITTLELANASLTQLPDDLFKLTGLERLDLSANKLDDLPEEFSALQNLIVLDLTANPIPEMNYAHLYELFAKMPKLQQVFFHDEAFQFTPAPAPAPQANPCACIIL